MSTAWEKSLLIAETRKGQGRSILGYAGESLIIGRALVCGYNLFFKAWRDSKYDAVLDHDGVLYRIEIKQTSTANGPLTTSSGGRTGQQINRNVASREETLSSQDCDFLFGVHSLTGKAWIIPIEVVEIFGGKSISLAKLIDFEEAWGIFLSVPDCLGALGLKERLRKKSREELEKICLALQISHSGTNELNFGSRAKLKFSSDVDKMTFLIWRELALRGQFKDE